MHDKEEPKRNLKSCPSRKVSAPRLLLFLSSLLAITIALCIPKQASGALTPAMHTTTNADSVHLLTFQNSTFGISMQYPSNWQEIQIKDNHEKESHSNDEAIAEFELPLSSSATNVVGKGEDQITTLTILIHKLSSQNIIAKLYDIFDKTDSQKTSLKALVLSHFTSLLTNLQDIHLINAESGEITLVGNIPAHKLVYTYKEQEPRRKTVMKSMEILMVNDDEGYIIRYLAPEPRFLDYMPSIEETINSFAIKR